MGRRYRKKRGKKGGKNLKGLVNLIKKVDRSQEFKNSPMIQVYKSYGSQISPTQLTNLYAIIQAPFQDIAFSIGGSAPNQNQRLSTTIYPQVIKFNGILERATAGTAIQRFRIMVIRYHGESDMITDNSALNGWESFSDEWSHVCRPGEIWSAKPFIKGQIKVLKDKTYVINDTNKSGIAVSISCQIKRKLVFETDTSGANAIGAGNVYLMITSDKSYNLSNYRTYGLYKQLL